jgi:hypothetical protein
MGRSRGSERPEPPDRAQQLIVREHPCELRRQCPHERELLLRQRDRRAAHAHEPCGRVDLQVADAQTRGPAAQLGAPQQRLDARPQLRVAERFAQVVITAVLEGCSLHYTSERPGRGPGVRPDEHVKGSGDDLLAYS